VVKRIVKVMSLVNSTPTFTEQHLVTNGASQLLGEVFGPEVGAHARSAFGVAQIPLGACVEIELIAEVREPTRAGSWAAWPPSAWRRGRRAGTRSTCYNMQPCPWCVLQRLMFLSHRHRAALVGLVLPGSAAPRPVLLLGC
jgi:hypothetical protein